MKYRGCTIEPADPEFSILKTFTGKPGFSVQGDGWSTEAPSIAAAKRDIDEEIERRRVAALQPPKPLSKSPNMFEIAGPYYQSEGGWRFHWTTQKSKDGYFLATTIRPTGPGARAGAKAIRKRELADERIPWKVVKRAKRRKLSDAKSIAEEWLKNHQKAHNERSIIKGREKEARILPSLLRPELLPEGIHCGALTKETPCTKAAGGKHGYIGDKCVALCPQHAANVTMDRKVFAVVDGEKRRVTREPRVGVIELDEDVVGPTPKSPRLRKRRSR